MTYTQEERGQVAEEYRTMFGKYPPILFELDQDTVIGIAEEAIKRGSPINDEDIEAALKEIGADPERSY